jgi:hypothetical protein
VKFTYQSLKAKTFARPDMPKPTVKLAPGAESQLRGLFGELLFEGSPRLGLLSFCRYAGIYIGRDRGRLACFPEPLSTPALLRRVRPILAAPHANLATWPPIVERVAEISGE